MNTREVVKLLGGAAELARALDLPGDDQGAKQVRAWIYRDSIPAEWFAAIARVAAKRGQAVTVESLAVMAENRRCRRLAQTGAAA